MNKQIRNKLIDIENKHGWQMRRAWGMGKKDEGIKKYKLAVTKTVTGM